MKINSLKQNYNINSFKSFSKIKNKFSEVKMNSQKSIDTFELSKNINNLDKPVASTKKKVGVAIASAIIPGLGQFINGDADRGFAYLGASIVTNLVGYQLLGSFSIIPSTLIAFASVYDAVRNVK